jgi:hypothetical protein
VSAEVAIDAPDGKYEDLISGCTVTVKNGKVKCKGKPLIFKV